MEPVVFLLSFLVANTLMGLGNTVGYHRLLTHRSFQCAAPLRWLWREPAAAVLCKIPTGTVERMTQGFRTSSGILDMALQIMQIRSALPIESCPCGGDAAPSRRGVLTGGLVTQSLTEAWWR